MKIYTVIETNDEMVLGLYTFKTRGDAEEFILSCAEEEAFTECNYSINILEYTDTLEECINMSRNWWKKYHCSNECIALYLGGINYDIRTIPSLED